MAKRTQSAHLDCASPSQNCISISDAHFVKKSRAAKHWRALSRSEETLLGSFDVGPYKIDLDSRVTKTVDRDISLTPMEYCVLKQLAAHRNVPVPHRELAKNLWGVYSGKGVHSLRCFIRSLRKKLEVDPAHPQYIITVTGVGYCLRP
jgi:DNA-binding response OmpR family regulator